VISVWVFWKVGRLKFDPVADQVGVIIDGPGEIRWIPRDGVKAIINQEDEVPVQPDGSVELLSRSGVCDYCSG
jgi:hypothetical protein